MTERLPRKGTLLELPTRLAPTPSSASSTTPVPSSSASVPGSGQGRRSQDSPKAVGTVSQATVLLQTRTLVIVDYHCVSDVSAAGCKPGTGFSDQAVEAFETFLREDSRRQLAVCSYIGSRSAERRRDLQSQVRSLSQYFGRKGVFHFESGIEDSCNQRRQRSSCSWCKRVSLLRRPVVYLGFILEPLPGHKPRTHLSACPFQPL